MTVLAIAGNPNSGKTTFFNSLTGARQHVGNYPGITVERKTGSCVIDGTQIHVEDLPGIYSLSAYSAEEVVSRNFLLNDNPDAVINVVDSSNLERNLYLTVQILEMGIPLAISLNMMDVAEKRGNHIDVELLSKRLGNIPVVPTVARHGKGVQESVRQALKATRPEPLMVNYGQDIEEAIALMVPEIEKKKVNGSAPARWMVIQFLEADELIRQEISEKDADLCAFMDGVAKKLKNHLVDTTNIDTEATIADQRYGFIRALIQNVVTRDTTQQRLFLSDRLDLILTNRLLGPIIMVGVIYGLYALTFSWSEWPVAQFEAFFEWLNGLADAHMVEGTLKSLVQSGIIDGVGGVMGFVPLIFIMFLGISFLEDTGYLARMAYMLDRIFRFFGLHGSSVMPFILSGGIAGGCAVPGVMATRTIRSRKERLATLLTAPFMNCGAKMPVFALLVSAFFVEHEALMMGIITALSWLGAMVVARVMRWTVLPGEGMPFVMELPPYRLPTLKGILLHTWERTWQYIRKAGTVILAISVLLWAMMVYPGLPEAQQENFENLRSQTVQTVPEEDREAIMTLLQAEDKEEPDEATTLLAERYADQIEAFQAIDGQEKEEALRQSWAGRIGRSIEPVTSWAGFDWRTNIALVGGFAAKEVIVSTLGTAYSLGEVDPEDSSSLSTRLQNDPGWNSLKALALIVFSIFYAPCFVTVVCIVREAGGWKWGLFSMGFNTALALLLAAGVYQIGMALGF